MKDKRLLPLVQYIEKRSKKRDKKTLRVFVYVTDKSYITGKTPYAKEEDKDPRTKD